MSTTPRDKLLALADRLTKLTDGGLSYSKFCGMDDELRALAATLPPDHSVDANKMVATDSGQVRIGQLPTVNQDEYPGLGDWWLQLWIGDGKDASVFARVYGGSPQEVHARGTQVVAALATHPPQQEQDGFPIDTCPVGEVVLVWWPLVKLDEDCELTDEVCGGQWLLSEKCEDGAWFEPSELDATGAAFDDDEDYARAPTFWRPLPPDPNHFTATGGEG